MAGISDRRVLLSGRRHRARWPAAAAATVALAGVAAAPSAAAQTRMTGGPRRVHLGCAWHGPAATFQVTPPSYAPNVSAVVHATATMGNMTRETGVTVAIP